MSDVVAAATERVAAILADSPVEAYRDDAGGFQVPYGSTVAFIAVTEELPGHAAVEVWAPVVKDVPLSPQLYRFAAQRSFMFGRLAVARQPGGSGQVVFAHGLVAEDLQPEELFVVLGAIATTADELDEEMVARFGGSRFRD